MQPPSTPISSSLKIPQQWIIPILLFLSAIPRLLLTWNADLSYEPTYYISTALLPWPDAFKAMVVSTQGPVNTLILKPWLLLSQSVWWIKTLPFSLSLFSVWISYRAISTWTDTTKGFWGALAFSLCPLILQLSFSPRYEPLILCCVWAHLWMLHRLFNSAAPTRLQWFIYGATLVIGTGAFALFLFFSAASFLVVLIFGKQKLFTKIFSVTLSGIFLLPLAGIYAWVANSLSTRNPARTYPTLTSILKGFLEMSVGLVLGFYRNWFDSDILSLVGKGIFISFAVMFLYLIFQKPKNKGFYQLGLFVIFCLTLGLLAHFKPGMPLHPKYFMWILPPIFLSALLLIPAPVFGKTLGTLTLGSGFFSLVLMLHQLSIYPNNLQASALAKKILKPDETLWVHPASFMGIPKTLQPQIQVEGFPYDHNYLIDAWGKPISLSQANQFNATHGHLDRLIFFLGQGEKPYTDKSGILVQELQLKGTKKDLLLFTEDNFFQPRAKLICIEIKKNACPSVPKPP